MLAQLSEQGWATDLVDVGALPAEALLAREGSTAVDEAVSLTGEAGIIVAATPTYRALYTGALKCLFDLMPPAHLGGKICVPIQTGASPAHFLTIDYGLKPLFASLGGVSIDGVYATDEQFTEGAPDGKLAARVRDVALAADTLARAVGA